LQWVRCHRNSNFNPASSSETKEHWLSTARVRLGAVPADRWLAYVTAA
jgi:hypothetical protein